MIEGEPENLDHLPRLSNSAYRGNEYVHWNFSIAHRKQGWLTPAFYQAFRWIMLHGCAHYGLACPAYCLMPDHLHLLISGLSPTADQRLFIRYLRRHLRPILNQAGVDWQKQPYDHVLRKDERDRFGVESVAGYIAQNPVEAGLVTHWQDWPYSGCVLPGYPEIDLRLPDYWQRLWRIVAARQK